MPAAGILTEEISTWVRFMQQRLKLRFSVWLATCVAATCSLAPLPALAQSGGMPTSSVNFTDTRYILEPGDVISIAVFGYEEYTGNYPIRSDGTITLPVVGTVMASGHTLDSLTLELRRQLDAYLVEPSVAVDLAQQRPINILVSGEVHRPGPTQLEGESPSLLTALSAVGGVTRRADIRQVTVRRSLPNGNTSTVTLNLWDTLWQANNDPSRTTATSDLIADLVLRDDDEIIVPQLAPGDTTVDRRLIAQSTFAPNTVRVRVVGEVNSPGEIQAPPNSSLSSAIAIAGGPSRDADLGDVEFVRLNEAGEIERREVDLSDLNDNFQVQEGDVVIVPRTDSSEILEWAGRILSPLGALLNIFNRF